MVGDVLNYHKLKLIARVFNERITYEHVVRVSYKRELIPHLLKVFKTLQDLE